MKRIISVFLLAGAFTLALPQTLIKMGTLAPDGSPWFLALQNMRDRWSSITGGQVRLRLYAGGQLGDEPDMVGKLRVGALQGVALSGAGMGHIDKGVACLQIPLMFDSYAELDYVRDKMAPRLEQMIAARGYLVLNWGDAGWVHFFSTKPVSKLGDLRSMPMFNWAGDNDALELWKANNFKVVPLAATDILPSLKTGLIQVVPTTPLYALLAQYFGLARYMCDIKWAPLVGATIVSKEVWEKIPAQWREPMRKAALETGKELREGIRKMGDDAVVSMQDPDKLTGGGAKKAQTRSSTRGLTVIHPDAAAMAEWRREAENVYPKMRGKLVPADLFDRVKQLRDEYRATVRKGK
jgi:TRAP-type transport system periplasmic protein